MANKITSGDLSYSLNDLIGKPLWAKKNLPIYKHTNKTVKPYTSIPAGSRIGIMDRYYIDFQNKTLWFIMKTTGGVLFAFPFVPGGNQIDFEQLKKVPGLKSWEQEAAENQKKYDKSPFDAFADTLSSFFGGNFKKFVPYLGAAAIAIILIKNSKNG